MGLDPDTAISHVRFSLGRENGDEDLDYLLVLLPCLVSRLRNADSPGR
jgi:cysteine sulfinate desulfinase/cysteine desulfurase-like protein